MKKTKKINNLTKLLIKIKQKIITNKQTTFTMLCTRLLNQRLKKSGVLKPKQSILTKNFSIRDFTNRKLYKIIQNKIKNRDFSLVLKLFREKKIFFKKKAIKSLNIFLSTESEKFLEIKV